MKIFISYSREDEAATHLLAYILTAHGIQCEIDRKLPPGESFTPNLKNMIKSADLVLVVLTNSAAGSAWVNQEIGFATAHEKPIWPIAIESNIEPQGMISSIPSYSLFDWSDPSNSVERLVLALRGSASGEKTPYRTFGLDRVIHGKTQRAEFLVRRFKNLLDDSNDPPPILNQSAFSVFSASNEKMYREAGGHSDRYMSLLMEEQCLLNELIHKRNAELKLIVWPVRAYDDKYLAVRYRNLLTWMARMRDNPRVSFVCAQYPGPNRYVVGETFCVEGFKLHDTTGYEMTIVKYQPNKIRALADEFHKTFDDEFVDKDTTIRRIQEMYKKVSALG